MEPAQPTEEEGVPPTSAEPEPADTMEPAPAGEEPEDEDMSQLPNEVWALVASFVGEPRDLGRLACVSKRFTEAVIADPDRASSVEGGDAPTVSTHPTLKSRVRYIGPFLTGCAWLQAPAVWSVVEEGARLAAARPSATVAGGYGIDLQLEIEPHDVWTVRLRRPTPQ